MSSHHDDEGLGSEMALDSLCSPTAQCPLDALMNLEEPQKLSDDEGVRLPPFCACRRLWLHDYPLIGRVLA